MSSLPLFTLKAQYAADTSLGRLVDRLRGRAADLVGALSPPRYGVQHGDLIEVLITITPLKQKHVDELNKPWRCSEFRPMVEHVTAQAPPAPNPPPPSHTVLVLLLTSMHLLCSVEQFGGKDPQLVCGDGEADERQRQAAETVALSADVLQKARTISRLKDDVEHLTGEFERALSVEKKVIAEQKAEIAQLTAENARLEENALQSKENVKPTAENEQKKAEVARRRK